jgi:hypothetical protein
MTKQFLILASGATLIAAAALAQTSPHGSAFQQPGWIAAPGGSLVTYPTLRPDAQSGPVSGKPFSATEVRHTVQTLADGTHVQDSSNSLFYRDAQGRMRSESSTQALIFDPVANNTLQLDLRNKTYQKNKTRSSGSVSIAVIGNRTSVNSSSSSPGLQPVIPPVPSSGKMAPGKAERKALVEGIHSRAITEDLPPQSVNGVYCRGSRVTETIPAGTFGNDRDIKIVSERWYSDDLQVLVKSSNSDPRFGVTTYELTNIAQAPPDQALFQVPADYTLYGGVMYELGHGVPATSKH